MNLLLFVVLIGTLSECKKGEDDPFISLRRRKARVVGDWKLTSGTSLSTSNSSNSSSTDAYTYTETSYSYNGTDVNNGNTTTSSDAGVYSYKIKFEKDGKFSATEVQGSDFTTYSGVWNFTHGVGEYKNKEQIALTIRSYITSGGSSGTYTGKDADFSMTIKELRNKKMVIYTDDTNSGTNSSGTNKSEIVLEQ